MHVLPLSDALQRPCVIDMSLLTNFLYSGNALLLRQVLSQPPHITPVILDPAEIQFIDSSSSSCSSEVLRPLFAAEDKQERYSNVRTQIMDLARAEGNMWLGVELTEHEYALARTYLDKSIWDKCPTSARRRKKGLGVGEAEVVAVAISRGWTALLDDQAAVDLMRCLAPDVPVVRTCALLVESVGKGLIECPAAEELFNEQICNDLLFHCRDALTGRVLRFRCNPPRCNWEQKQPGDSGS